MLRLLREKDSDGYTLVRRSGLQRQEVEQALGLLLDKGLVRSQGNASAGFESAYFWVTPEARGIADYVTGRVY